jgi:hypothetical protein
MIDKNYTGAAKASRYYLAGPMTGIKDLNFPLFHAEAARLRALGYEIINPAEINGGADDLLACASMTPEQLAAHWQQCMRKDITVLMTCDGIALLPGWEGSRGACLEHHNAAALGMDVHLAANLGREPLKTAVPATDWAAV